MDVSFVTVRLSYLLSASRLENTSSVGSIGTGCGDAGLSGNLCLICWGKIKFWTIAPKILFFLKHKVYARVYEQPPCPPSLPGESSVMAEKPVTFVNHHRYTPSMLFTAGWVLPAFHRKAPFSPPTPKKTYIFICFIQRWCIIMWKKQLRHREESDGGALCSRSEE